LFRHAIGRGGPNQRDRVRSGSLLLSRHFVDKRDGNRRGLKRQMREKESIELTASSSGEKRASDGAWDSSTSPERGSGAAASPDFVRDAGMLIKGIE
ncbi:MAG: hypothetical protein Q9181_004393, partial [Wetmoreana brouardii]